MAAISNSDLARTTRRRQRLSHAQRLQPISSPRGKSVRGGYLEAVRRLRPAPCKLARQGQARAHRRARPFQRKKTRQAGAERRRAVGR